METYYWKQKPPNLKPLSSGEPSTTPIHAYALKPSPVRVRLRLAPRGKGVMGRDAAHCMRYPVWLRSRGPLGGRGDERQWQLPFQVTSSCGRSGVEEHTLDLSVAVAAASVGVAKSGVAVPRFRIIRTLDSFSTLTRTMKLLLIAPMTRTNIKRESARPVRQANTRSSKTILNTTWNSGPDLPPHDQPTFSFCPV
jgi:hypothetical protein